MKTVIVSSGCQSFGIAAALQALFPDRRIVARPMPDQWECDDQEQELASHLVGADIWISSNHWELASKHLGTAAPHVVRAPLLGFAAFQPDICYGYRRSTGSLTRHHYNSAIVMWAYRNRVLPTDAVRLFAASVFRDLGYFQTWQPSVDSLHKAFCSCGLDSDFETFFLSIQRTGSFMHSINHPRVHALVRLAKVLGLRMGADRSILNQHVEIDDFLSQSTWPVYPDIAKNLSIPGGSYDWKINMQTQLYGVEAYVEFAYSDYQQQGIEPSDIVMCNRDEALYDRVLTAALRHT